MADTKVKSCTCPECRGNKHRQNRKCGVCDGKGELYETFTHIPTGRKSTMFLISNNPLAIAKEKAAARKGKTDEQKH